MYVLLLFLSTLAMDRLPHPGERDLEIVFALAGPVGADLQEVSRMLGDALKKCDYAEVEEIDVGGLIRQIAAKRTLTRADGSPIRLIEAP